MNCRRLFLLLPLLLPILAFGQASQANFPSNVGTTVINCGTNDDTCITGPGYQNLSNFDGVLPGNSDGSLRTYNFAHGILLSNVTNWKLRPGNNVLIQAAAGMTDSFLFKITTASSGVTLGEAAGNTKAIGTNLNNGSNNAALFKMEDQESVINSLTQPGAGQPCGAGTVPFAYSICIGYNSALPNATNINATTGPIKDAPGLIYAVNPPVWSSGPDLSTTAGANKFCDQSKCAIARTGPLTCPDTTHCYFSTNEFGTNNPSGLTAYIAGGRFDIGPYKVNTIQGFDVSGSPRDGVTSSTYFGPYALVRNQHLEHMHVHDNGAGGNYGVRFYKALDNWFIDSDCINLTQAQQCYQGQGDFGAIVMNVKADKLFAQSNSQPTPITDFRAGFSSGVVFDNLLSHFGSAVYAGSEQNPALYFDTCLACKILNSHVEGGGSCVDLEVDMANSVIGNTFENCGYIGVQSRYRADYWKIYTFNAITTNETPTIFSNTGETPNVLFSQAPIAYNGVTLAQGIAAVPAQSTSTGEMKITTTASFTQTTQSGVLAESGLPVPSGLMWCIDAPTTSINGTGNPNAAGNGTNALVCNGSQCVLTLNASSPFTASPTLTGGLTNVIVITSATNTSINGVHTVLATAGSTVTFYSTLNGTFNESGTVTQGGTVRLDPQMLRRIWVGSPSGETGATGIPERAYALMTSTQPGCVPDQSVMPGPRFYTADWGPQKTFADDRFGQYTSGTVSWGMICIGTCNNAGVAWVFDVTEMGFDIGNGDGNHIDNNNFWHTFITDIRITGGHNVGISNNDFWDSGWGSGYGTTNKPNAGTSILLDASTLNTANLCTNVDHVTINGNTPHRTLSSLSNRPDVSLVKALTGSTCTVSGTEIGLNNFHPDEFFAGNLYQLSAESDTPWILGRNKQQLSADSASITATTAATAVTVFSWPELPVNGIYDLHCGGSYTQLTGNSTINITVQGATLAPKQLKVNGQLATSGTTVAAGSSGAITNTTSTLIVSGTGTASPTEFPWSLDGQLETANGDNLPLASLTTLNIGFFTGNAADAVVVKRDSYCVLHQSTGN